MQNDEIDFSPVVKAVGRYWGRVLLWTIIGGLVALGVTFILPPKWKCQAALLLPLESNGTSGLAQLIGGKADPLEMMKGVLESRTNEQFLADQTHMEVKDVDKELAVQTQKDQNQVIVSFTDHSKPLAMQLTNLAIDRLRELSANGNLSLAVIAERNLKQDVDDRRKRLENMEAKLKTYTKHSQTPVDPTNPFASDYRAKLKEAEYELGMINQQIDTALAKAKQMGQSGMTLPTAIPNQETLRERLVSQQYQLDTLSTQLGPDNPQVKALNSQIAVTKKLISSEVAKYLAAANQGIDPTLAALFGQRQLLQYQKDFLSQMADVAPDEAVRAADLYREVMIEQDAYKFMRTQYEQAKASGLVDPLQWSVLDEPYFGDKPENKKFGLYTALGCIAGLFVGCVFASRKAKKVRLKGARKVDEEMV